MRRQLQQSILQIEDSNGHKPIKAPNPSLDVALPSGVDVQAIANILVPLFDKQRRDLEIISQMTHGATESKVKVRREYKITFD